MKKSTLKIVAVSLILNASAQTFNYEPKNKTNMIETIKENPILVDNSKKTILARGCDPIASLEFSKIVPSLIGNAKYIPSTDDADFIEKLKTKKWSIVFFAPGACRFSAAKHSIPGGNSETARWTLKEYRELVYELQGDQIKIVEAMDERETVTLLNKALQTAREIK